MSYFMRYISTDDRPLSLPILGDVLRSIDSKYSIRPLDPGASQQTGKLMYGRGLYALLDIKRPAGGGCESLDELKAEVEESEGKEQQRVLDVLEAATDLLTVEVKWQGRTTEKTLERINPLWKWLFENRRGLLQCDGEGFYQGPRLVLDLEGGPNARKITPPCRYCGKPLRAELARQCFECGMDWHDPGNVVNRGNA